MLQSACLSIWAVPGGGKTSLLRFLAHPEVKTAHTAELRGRAVIYIDSAQVRDPEAFYDLVAQSVVESNPTVNTSRYSLPSASPDQLYYLLDDVAHPPVLLLDNISVWGKKPAFTPEFFGFLRGISQGADVVIVTASDLQLCDCLPLGRGSPFFNIFQVETLGALSGEAVHDLLSAQVQPRTELPHYAPEIRELSGDLPLFLKLACHHYAIALQKNDGNLAGQARQELVDIIEQACQPYYRRMWLILPEEGKRLVASVARGEELSRWDLQQADMMGLRERGYIRDGELFSRLFARFVRSVRE
jgi:hypothetical protein